MTPRPRIVFTAFAALVLLHLAPFAWAGPAEDAARNTERARTLLTQAMNDARQADDDLRQINNTLATAQSRQRDLTRQLDQHKKQKQDLAQRNKDATAALPRLQSALAAAQDSLTQAAAPRDAARKQFDADQTALAAVRQKAADAFHAAAPYQQAQAAVQAASAAIDTATTICLGKVEASAEYRQALQAFDDAVKDLEKSKKALPPGHPRLIAASQKMIDTDSVVRSMRLDALARDPALNDAKRQSERAQAAMQSLVAEFEKQVLLQPDMIAAAGRSDKSKMLLSLAETQWKQADAARAQADAALQSARNDIAEAKAKLSGLDTAIASDQRDLDDLSRTVDLANKRLPVAQRASRDAAQKLADAQRAYDQARANEIRLRAQQNK